MIGGLSDGSDHGMKRNTMNGFLSYIQYTECRHNDEAISVEILRQNPRMSLRALSREFVRITGRSKCHGSLSTVYHRFRREDLS